MTSGKFLTPQDVLHVPTLQRNLISESSFVRAGYRIVKKCNKFVFSKSNFMFEKGDGLFWLNVVNPSNNKIFIHVALNI